ncbi:MAG: metallophosphoesterase [Clostridia bacterium]|nr:metallophosphoesterase [Clostridia bacterium]
MKLFAIADLHLPGGDDKPMEVFGPHWEGHFARISEDWRARVSDEDAVLIPGDISWAMQLSHAVPDLQAIGALPGRKFLIKGNHDYWWSSLTRVQAAMPEGMKALQHSAADAGPWVICGTRGWVFPTGDELLAAEDRRIYERELLRLEMALREARKLAERPDGTEKPIVAMLHYPPLYDAQRDTAFTAMLTRYGVHTAVYGHLHGAGIRAGWNGTHGGVRYLLTSCDSLGFVLREVDMTT